MNNSVETDEYYVCANVRRWFFQKERMEWLVVGYYWNDVDSEKAAIMAEKRANQLRKRDPQTSVRTLIHKRQVWC